MQPFQQLIPCSVWQKPKFLVSRTWRNIDRNVFQKLKCFNNFFFLALLEQNKKKIETCVSQVCVDNNLEIISQEYVTLLNNVNTEVEKVKSFRTSVSQKFVDTLSAFQTAISKAENTGSNQMKKCL